MSNCKACGRALREGERCACSIDDSVSNDYYKISIKKETVKAFAEGVGNFTQSIAEKSDDVVIHANDGAFEHGLGIIGTCVVPNEKEIPVRQYNIAQLSTPILKKAYGRLQVTNKRVIFRSAGRSLCGPIITESEFAIEDISGVQIKTDYRFSLLVFILSLLGANILGMLYVSLFLYVFNGTVQNSVVPSFIMTIILTFFSAVLLLFVSHKRVFKSAAFLACGCSYLILSGVSIIPSQLIKGSSGDGGSICVMLALVSIVISLVEIILAGIVDDLHLMIKVSGAEAAVEVGRKLRLDERSGFMIVKPWKDTEIAIRELGALIDDIKHFGDAGISKWSV